MKTQINTFVRGTPRIAGTNRMERLEVAERVIAENGDVMIIAIRGYIIRLDAYRSISGKSVHYSGSFPLELYNQLFGTFGIPVNNPEANITINGDMTVVVTTNSKSKNRGRVIAESEVNIL